MLNMGFAEHVQEIREGLIPVASLAESVRRREAIILKGTAQPVCVGHGMLVKVNTNIGVSTSEGLDAELRKLELLTDVGYSPDMLMDHTLVHVKGREFYARMIDGFPGPVGTLPHYLAFRPGTGIDAQELLDISEAQAESGVSFMTLHPTPSRSLFELASASRSVPTTSRGGGLVLKDLYLNDRPQNVIAEAFPELLDLLRRNNMGLSVGSTFRPASVAEALDAVHVEETARQGDFVRMARDAGVPVQLEGIGHITLDRIPDYIKLVSDLRVPMMPLGPLPTDAAIGEDHIVNAVGAVFTAFLGGAHVVNSITCEEHTGGVPSGESILQGLKAARIAAHIVNIARFKGPAELDARVASDRAAGLTCVTTGGLFSRSAEIRHGLGCTRCGERCPLTLANRAVVEQGLGTDDETDDLL